MKRIGKIFFIFIIFSFVILNSLFAQEFSADVSSTTMGKQVSGKIYNAPGKARMETNEVIAISRIDKNIAWILMPKEKTYMEVPLTSSSIIAGNNKMPGEIERKLIGKETLGGKVADKYYIVYSAAGKTQAVYSWILPDLGIPAKTVAEDGSWQVEYRNINVGKQPDSLFEVPSGYNKFSLSSVKDMIENTIKGALRN
ncbi:MAG: DUF4412 domain-containing protein [Candidatus Omnitrophica bacterium]|jgi:hypothetical protein|nr:DUF4412 domain-containing protein [Candidatus Omnitrophota bacterium]